MLNRHHHLAALCIGVMIGSAHADEGKRAPRVPLSPQYRQECSDCHVPFAPRLLPAASWQRLMSNLPNHFGTDASIDPASAREITNWLTANAGTSKRTREAPPDDRITKAPWFIREHREISVATWQMPTVKTPSNCAACHTQADQGDFNEHNVKIPR